MQTPQIYLDEIGWTRSIREKRPVDAQGEPVPWYTYPFISFLQAKPKLDWNVFEFGAGYSTLWWAGRVASVTSCEHDAVWCELLEPQLPPNVILRKIPLVRGGDYCREVLRSGPYDVVVVDGRDRVSCVKNAVYNLSDSGVIILDNSERRRYRVGIDFLKRAGFRQIEFAGIAPGSAFGTVTSLFYRPGSCFEI